MTDTKKFSLEKNPAHLGLGAKVIAQPEFTGMQWYADYSARTATDGVEGRLVSFYHFNASWGSWEMHPEGDELVVCTQGEMTLIQEVNGKEERVVVRAGEAIINPRGVWHTADVNSECAALFITAGIGTQHRPRTS